MNMQFHALRRRDWLQQYANAKSLQKFLQTFANFCKFAKTFANLQKFAAPTLKQYVNAKIICKYVGGALRQLSEKYVTY